MNLRIIYFFECPYTSWTAWTNNTSFNVTLDTGELGVWNYTLQYNDSVGLWGMPRTVLITITSEGDNTLLFILLLIIAIIGITVVILILVFRKKSEKGHWITKDGRRIFIKDKK